MFYQSKYADQLMKISIVLGGNALIFISSDADLSAATYDETLSKDTYNGQVLAFLERLKEAVSSRRRHA